MGRLALPFPELPATGDLLVWFHNPSCGPCRAMEPAVGALAVARHAVIAVDFTLGRADAQAWSIAATSTSIFVRDGRVAASCGVAVSKATLDALISAWAERPTVLHVRWPATSRGDGGLSQRSPTCLGPSPDEAAPSAPSPPGWQTRR